MEYMSFYACQWLKTMNGWIRKAPGDFFFFFKQQILGPHYLGVYVGWGCSGHSYIFQSSPTDSRISGNVNHTMERSPRVKVFPKCALQTTGLFKQTHQNEKVCLPPPSLPPIFWPGYKTGRRNVNLCNCLKKKNQIQSYTVIMLWLILFF